MFVEVNKNILENNEAIAQQNRQIFRHHRVKVINLLGSPGAGKTSFLEAILEEMSRKYRVGVIEGDLSTSLDAQRIARLGVPVVQINTQGGCHLDSRMIAEVLSRFDLASLDLLIIENVGNLVCPAAFDLGEDMKIVVLSVAEGGDKPAKYPRTFLEAEAVVINKIDLLPFTDVDLPSLEQELLTVNSRLQIFPVSCRQKEGLAPWHKWLEAWLGKSEGEVGHHAG